MTVKTGVQIDIQDPESDHDDMPRLIPVDEPSGLKSDSDDEEECVDRKAVLKEIGQRAKALGVKFQGDLLGLK